MRRTLIAVVLALAALAVFGGGLGWLLDTPTPPPGAPPVQRLYYVYCASCHGVDGRGSWRATLFLIDPGDLTDGARMRTHADRYLFDIIKHGGAPIGRPGMPAFGHALSDADIAALVAHLRELAE